MKCKCCGLEAELNDDFVIAMYWCKTCNKELCPDCGAFIRGKELYEGGGIECADKCGYWFCF